MIIAYFRDILIVFISAAILSACVSSKFVISDVTRHHKFEGVPLGATFEVIGSDDSQSQSLAFLAHAALVESKLTDLGFTKHASDDQVADIVVTMSWSIEGPSPDVKSSNNSFSYGFGYGAGYNRLSANLLYPLENRTSTKQLYNRNVELVIYAGDSYSTDERQRLFEASVVSTGNRPNIDPVMTYILDAIFDGFPGTSGENLMIRIPVQEGSPLDNNKMYNSRMGQ